MSETELYPLIARRLEGVHDAGAHTPVCDCEYFGDWLILHPGIVFGLRTRFSVEDIYTGVSTSRGNDVLPTRKETDGIASKGA
jgi:hypothetical protein